MSKKLITEAESILMDKHAINFAEWLRENTVYSGDGFYTSFIPKHNNCQFKLVQLIKYYNSTL